MRAPHWPPPPRPPMFAAAARRGRGALQLGGENSPCLLSRKSEALSRRRWGGGRGGGGRPRAWRSSRWGSALPSKGSTLLFEANTFGIIVSKKKNEKARKAHCFHLLWDKLTCLFSPSSTNPVPVPGPQVEGNPSVLWGSAHSPLFSTGDISKKFTSKKSSSLYPPQPYARPMLPTKVTTSHM